MGLAGYFTKQRITGIALGFCGGIVIWATSSLLSSDIRQGTETEFALTILQLTALTLPALAIILQAALTYSRQRRYQLTGQTKEIQYSFFGIVGIASFLLALSVYVIFESIHLSSSLDVSLLLVNLALFCFAAIPIMIASYEFIHKDDDFMKTIDAIELAKLAKEIEETDEYHLSKSFEAFNINRESDGRDVKKEEKESEPPEEINYIEYQ